MKIQDYFRSIPGGGAQGDVTVTLKKHSDNSQVTTATTNATTGFYEITQSLNPGPVYWTATSGGVTRSGSSKTYGMSGPLSVYELVYVLKSLGSGKVKGYANQLNVTATGTRQVSVATGAALVNGMPVTIHSAQSPGTAGSEPNATRTDVLVLQVTNPGQAEEGKAELVIKEGVTASTVTASANTSILPLATLTLSDPYTSYSVAQIDTWLLDTAAFPARSEVKLASVTESQTTNVAITSTTGSSVLGGTVTLTNGVIYDLTLRVFLLTATNSGNVGLKAWWNTTSTTGPEMLSGASTHSGMEAVFTTTVTGTGSSVSFGALVYKTEAGATASRRSGWALLQAIPRT